MLYVKVACGDVLYFNFGDVFYFKIAYGDMLYFKIADGDMLDFKIAAGDTLYFTTADAIFQNW